MFSHFEKKRQIYLQRRKKALERSKGNYLGLLWVVGFIIISGYPVRNA
jgi:hypothetical protein